MSISRTIFHKILNKLKRRSVPYNVHVEVIEENKMLKKEIVSIGVKYNSLLEYVEEQNSIIETMAEKFDLLTQKIDIIEIKARLNKTERSQMENLDVALSKLIFKPKRKKLPGFEYYDESKIREHHESE